MPRSVHGLWVTPIFQLKILNEEIFGSFPRISGPSMFPQTARTGASCSRSSMTVRLTRSPACTM